MAIASFPPIEEADRDGLLAIGGDLEVSSLILAYSQGIFPWPLDEQTLAWFAPRKRAVLFLSDLHISKSLAREMRKTPFSYSVDKAFREVISGCAQAENRKGQHGTWITEEMISAYEQLFYSGYAHSIEVWNDDTLAGGVYGVSLGGLFAAESMYYTEPNASKLALIQLTHQLKAAGVTWMDVQVLNPFTEKLGARNIARGDYMKLLAEALKVRARPEAWIIEGKRRFNAES